jgi:Phosphatidylserine synthase
MCRTFPLAWFNLTASEQSKYFQGLPTPLAAFFIASLVIHTPWITSHACRVLLYHKVLPVLVVCIAFLMVSSIPFPTFKEWRMRSVREYTLVSLILCISLLCYLQGYPLFFFLTTGYICIGIIRSLQHS